MRITVAQLNPVLGDLAHNLALIQDATAKAVVDGADLVVFPELVLTGYCPRDMLFFPDFRDRLDQALSDLMAISHRHPIPMLVGAPLWSESLQLFTNSVLGLYNGDMVYVRHKTLLPNYGIFEDKRYFAPSESPASVWPLVTATGKTYRVGVAICEDAWVDRAPGRYGRNPVTETMALAPDVLVVTMASPYEIGKPAQRRRHFSRMAAAHAVPVVMVNQVGAHDDLIFDGTSLVIHQVGHPLFEGPSFDHEVATVVLPFVAPDLGHASVATETYSADTCAEMYAALCFSLREYVTKTGFQKVLLGLSGGIDSALTAAIAVDALGGEHVLGVAMPSRYSSPDSLRDAEALADALGMRCVSWPIEDIHAAYEKAHPDLFGTGLAAENIQPRIRGNLLMGLSNSTQALLLSTGNKSESAMGYCTLYGDMCGALCVLGDVYKTEVFALAEWRNQRSPVIPQYTLDRPPSAELRPDQTDQDSLPPYPILDAVLCGYFEERQSVSVLSEKYGAEIVRGVVSRFHANEYKRKQSAVIPRLRTSAFGPGYRMPIVGKIG